MTEQQLSEAYVQWRDHGDGRDCESIPDAFAAGWKGHEMTDQQRYPTREQIAAVRGAVVTAEAYTMSDETAEFVVRELLALFPQPVPSTRPCAWCDAPATGTAQWQGSGRHLSCGEHGHDYVPVPAAPPSIADMAPGTTFTAGKVAIRRFRRTEQGRAVEIDTGRTLHVSQIDPSTIRDVTPPPTTP